MACPWSGNEMFLILSTVMYSTAPSNVHPGIVLFLFSVNDVLFEFSGSFEGGDSKSAFLRSSENEQRQCKRRRQNGFFFFAGSAELYLWVLHRWKGGGGGGRGGGVFPAAALIGWRKKKGGRTGL